MNTKSDRIGDYLIIILYHPELKKEEILVIQVKAREVLEKDTSWKRYWKMRAKHEAEIFLNGGYEIKKIILESISAISYFSMEIK